MKFQNFCRSSFAGRLPMGLTLVLGIVLAAFPILGAELPPIGVIEPLMDVALSAPVPGIITARKVQEGDFVREGTVLVELDSTLERLEVERRKLACDQKRSDFEATEKLFKATKGVSKEEVDKKEAEYKIARAEYDIAVEQERRRKVIAPVSGAVAEILLEVGEACQPYQTLLRVVDAHRCYLVAHVEARKASMLKLGQKLKLELDADDGVLNVPGEVVFISPVIDPASGLQRVKVAFENKNFKVRPGGCGKILLE